MPLPLQVEFSVPFFNGRTDPVHVLENEGQVAIRLCETHHILSDERTLTLTERDWGQQLR